MHYYEPPAPTALDRVRDLTEHLANLASRVRAAVAEAVAETLSRIARDAADRLLRPSAPEPVHGYSGQYPGRYEEADPWDDAHSNRPENPSMNASPDRDTNRSALGQAIAAGLAAAGWWARRGNPLAALGAGVTVAAAVASGGYLGRTGRAVIGAMAELLALAGPMARGATQPNRP